MNHDEAAQKYSSVLRAGRRYLSEKTAAGENGYLPVMEELIAGVRLEGELYIGLREIPLKKIAGTYAAGRSPAFAGNFMPLLGTDTEFASKWEALYTSHMEEGIRDPIRVYEYLGFYYVVEGNKRVSVLSSVGAYSAYAEVTRVLPARSEEACNRIFYEFLDFDRRRLFDDIWFSKPGVFTRLVEKARAYAAAIPELSGDKGLDWMFSCYDDFARVYHELGFSGEFPITTGDAFAEYVHVFGFPYGLSDGGLTDKIRAARPQFKVLSGDSDALRIDYGCESVSDGKRGAPFYRKRNVDAALALEGTPAVNGWPRTHWTAYRMLEAKPDGKTGFAGCAEAGEGADRYRVLSELCGKDPSLLFASGPALRRAALQIALERRETAVLCCSPYFDVGSLSTYYCRLFEAFYLCGILAGAVSASGTLGVLVPAPGGAVLPCDINAFASGAQLINPDCRIKLVYLKRRDDLREIAAARRKLSGSGADTALISCPDGGPVLGRLPGETAASLCRLHEDSGEIREYLAAVTLNWAVFYRYILEAMSAGADAAPIASGKPMHYRWGMDSGMLEVLASDVALGGQPARLFRLFRRLILCGAARPFDVTMADRDGTVRIREGKYPSFSDVAAMNWLSESVEELRV